MVGSMIAAGLGLTATTAAGLTVLTTTGMAAAFAINFAVSMIVTRVFGQDQQGPQDSGTREQVPPSNTNAIPIVYGDAYLGGTFVDAALSEDQKVMFYVMAISCISPNGQFSYDLSQCYYGDRLISFSGSGNLIGYEIYNGGADYAVGDVLTISGGTSSISAQLTVTSIGSGGVITGVSISRSGNYTALPNNPASVTGGTGSNAKFILQFSTYTNSVQALSDEAGNIDTSVWISSTLSHLMISVYTSDVSGNITTINSGMPWVVMGGTDIPADLRWPSTGRRMNGLAFAIIRLGYNSEIGTTSLSPITFKCKHYLYGTGAAKPGHVWYDYITNTAYGGSVDPSFVDIDSGIALNNYSDEIITFQTYTGSPSTQPRYRINGVIDAGQTVLSNLDKIMTCCDSWMAYNAASGKWSVVINKSETPVYSFDDDNIIGEIRVSATDITQSINQVEAKFPNKEARDQPDFVNLATPFALRYPNEPDNKYSVNYDLCNDSVQAQYLANRILEQAREDLIVSFSTTYYGIQVDAGSVVSVTNSDYGWTNKLFRVVKVNEASLPDGSLGAKLEMTEYSSAVYDNFNITQYTPVPNSGLPSPIYFSALSAPTVTASRPTAQIPSFDVAVTIPLTGRVTYGELFYTTTPSDPTSWKVLATASTTNGQPVTPGVTYTFLNQVLPTGIYYFSYIVGNSSATSPRSPNSASFNWAPVGMVGPTGPTGNLGPTGPTGTGDTGPRNAQVYFFYNTPQSSAPTAPTTAQVAYNFSTSTPTITAAGWSSTFNPASVGTTTANNKYWAVRVIFQEITYGGSYSETISSVFTWQNMDGLVTFTNLSNGLGPLGTNTTYIDGGTITTNTLVVDRIKNNTTGTFNTYVTFGLGTGSAIGGYAAGGAFSSSNVSYYGLLAANTAGGNAFGAGTTSTTSSNAAITGVGYGNSTFSTFRMQGTLGTGQEGGSFQTGGANNLQTATTADIRLARYTGGVSYAYYIISGSAFPFTAGHDGLQLLTETTPDIGDIMVDDLLIAADDINNTITQMSASSSANQQGAVGVFVGVSGADFVPAALGMYTESVQGTMTDFVLKPEYANIYDTYRPIAVNAIGEGKINVCGQGGDIAIGDLIVCSDTPGKGMKQSDDVFHSYTVAKARENVTFSSPTEVKQIACIYMAG